MRIIHKITITLLLLVFTSPALIADYVNITNTKGKTIEVKIFSLTEDKVKLQIRGDYKIHNYPLAQLDITSQNLVKNLMEPTLVNTEVDTKNKIDRIYNIDLVSKYRDLKLKRRKRRNRGTTNVLSFTHILDYTLAKAGSDEMISPEFLIWAGHEHSGRTTTQDDSWYGEIITSMPTYGIVTEKDFPYKSKYDSNALPNEKLIKIAEKNLEILNNANFKIRCIINPTEKTYGLEDKYIEQIIQLLDKGIPVTLGSRPSISIFGYKGKGAKDKHGVFLTMDTGNKNTKRVNYEYMKTVPYSAFYIEIDPNAKINLISK
jgi:hypothetical protein